MFQGNSLDSLVYRAVYLFPALFSITLWSGVDVWSFQTSLFLCFYQSLFSTVLKDEELKGYGPRRRGEGGRNVAD
jgi:hypothetical protein